MRNLLYATADKSVSRFKIAAVGIRRKNLHMTNQAPMKYDTSPVRQPQRVCDFTGILRETELPEWPVFRAIFA